MKNLVVLTGSGISVESGIQTFREMGGLWEQYNVTEVASPIAWANNPELVLRFYNERRKKLFEAKPNLAHVELAKLQEFFKVHIITQNVDDLHERAGSNFVIHLHGELKKVRSTIDEKLIYELDQWELKMGDKCEKGSQLRPHIVWFGEAVPLIEAAAQMASKADLFVVIGTSLNVYPAAGLIDYVPSNCPLFLVDPDDVSSGVNRKFEFIKEKASKGVPMLAEILKDRYL